MHFMHWVTHCYIYANSQFEKNSYRKTDLMNLMLKIEPHHDKTYFLYICAKEEADQLGVIVQLISAFIFAAYVEKSLYYLNLKFQASSLVVPGVFQKYAEMYHRNFAISASILIFHLRHA